MQLVAWGVSDKMLIHNGTGVPSNYFDTLKYHNVDGTNPIGWPSPKQMEKMDPLPGRVPTREEYQRDINTKLTSFGDTKYTPIHIDPLSKEPHECVVCHGEEVMYCRLPCTHVVHARCIDICFKQCPVCEREYNSFTLRRWSSLLNAARSDSWEGRGLPTTSPPL